jgi:biopolymer transport protein ExbD
MSLIPDEEIREQRQVNLAPMVDFLFLVVALFAVLAITRAALYDTEIDLVKIKPAEKEPSLTEAPSPFVVNISVSEDGRYRWVSEAHQYTMENVSAIQSELAKQQRLGLLPDQKDQIKVLLHIDKNATWEPIAKALVGVRQGGFAIHPVYEPNDN